MAPWKLSAMIPILSVHKETLRYIGLGNMRGRSLSGFDLTGFDNLESLHLSRWATGCNAAEVLGILAAPRIREFHWWFTKEYLARVNLFDFGDEEEAWVRALAAAAAASGSPLDMIFAHFDPARAGLWRWVPQNVTGEEEQEGGEGEDEESEMEEEEEEENQKREEYWPEVYS